MRSVLSFAFALACGGGASGGAMAQQPPTPASVLGHTPGADFVLADWEGMSAYFEELAAASDRVELLDVGATAEGRRWFVLMISSPNNLQRLGVSRAGWLALARAESGEAQARELASSLPALVHIDGGMHSTEAANAQHTLQLAYDLASGEDDRTRRILDNVVLMLWPTLNPDGLQMVAEWYNGNVGSRFEVSPLPALYQKYVGHDNNRDAYMLNTVESRVIARTWRQWEPQIVHTHHQSSPFPTRIWLPPFAEPIAPRAPALPSRTVNVLGMTMARALEAEGLRGATHMDLFDAWYPGYGDYLPIFQNVAAYWTETALYRYATPRFYTADDFPENRRDLRAEALYVSPWEGGWWRIGDAVRYMNVASHAVLDHAARYRDEILLDRYRAGREQIDRYRNEPPYAYFVPQRQRDPVAAVELLRRLAFNGITVARMGRELRMDGVTVPADSWVIPMDQPFAELVRQLFELQVYPDLRDFPEGPPSQPYDFAGWTLPEQMDVRVIPATRPLTAEERDAIVPLTGDTVDWRRDLRAEDARAPAIDAFTALGPVRTRTDASPFDTPRDEGFDTHPIAAAIHPRAGSITGSGAAVLADPAQNNAFRLVNRALRAGARVRFEGGLYRIQDMADAAMRSAADELALELRRGSAAGALVEDPRIGLYRPWRPSMDEGWTRWMLERFGFRVRGLRNADVRAAELGERYDVIVLPSESPAAIRDGFEPGTVPPRFAGGLGEVGLRAIDAFVRGGGTLVCLNRSSDLAIEALGLPVRNVVAELPRDSFFVSGSIVEVQADTTHPVMAGMPRRAKVIFDRSPAFETLDGFDGTVIARYAEHGSPLLSGYLLGEEYLEGEAAAVEVRHGQGRVLLIGFRPQWRGQPFGTFRVLMNALLTPAASVPRP